MSNINTIIVEDLGFHGVNMYNTQYPAYCDNGNRQQHAKSEGSPAISFGGSNFAKEESLTELPNTHGKPNVSYGKSPEYADYENSVTGGGGRPAVIYKR